MTHKNAKSWNEWKWNRGFKTIFESILLVFLQEGVTEAFWPLLGVSLRTLLLFFIFFSQWFPDFFQQKLTKHEFEVLFKVIQTFTSEENLEKVFSIKDYFKNYQSTLNNSQKIKIKNYFIQVIQRLKEDDLIENNYKIIRDGHSFNTNKLTSKNINEGFIIYEKLNL